MLNLIFLNPTHADHSAHACSAPLPQLLVLAPFSILVVMLCGLINSMLYVLFLTLLVSLPHASFHEVVELDALDALELEGLQSNPSAV